MTQIIIQDEILQCAICISMLDENSKMLPCQHTFCKECLKDLITRNGPLNCPMCQQAAPSIQDISHVEQLPGNLIINNLIGEIKKNPHINNDEDKEMYHALSKSVDDYANKKLLEQSEKFQLQMAVEKSNYEAQLDDLKREIQRLRVEKQELELKLTLTDTVETKDQLRDRTSADESNLPSSGNNVVAFPCGVKPVLDVQKPSPSTIQSLFGKRLITIPARRSIATCTFSTPSKSESFKIPPYQLYSPYQIRTRSQIRREQAERLKQMNVPCKPETPAGVINISSAENSGDKVVTVTSNK